jgi:hypothetical protein
LNRKEKAIKMTVKKSKSELRYVIVRTYSAGVFAGYLKSREGKEVVLTQARRLWYWKGAASLSQLSVDGVACPGECKFPCEVPEVTLLEAIEILTVSDKAKASIAAVPIWAQ